MVLSPICALPCNIWNSARNLMKGKNLVFLMVPWSCCVEKTNKSWYRSKLLWKRKTFQKSSQMSIQRHSSIETWTEKASEELDSVEGRTQTQSVCSMLTEGKNTPVTPHSGSEVEMLICAGNQAANKCQVHPNTSKFCVPPRRR